MYIDPRHLEHLAAIVDHGTLREAAEYLGTTQPALSRMLANLEARIGVQLFERESRPLAVTEVGHCLAEQGRSIRVARLRAAEDVSLDSRGMRGELKVGAPPFLCDRLVSDAISSFFTGRPKVTVQLQPDYSPELERKLLLNQLDVVICPIKLVVSTHADIRIEPLFNDDHVIVLRRGHPLTKQAIVSAAELSAATWIGHSTLSMLRTDMSTALASIGVTNLRLAFQSEASGAVLEMLRKSDFLTVLPRYALSHGYSESGLAVLPITLDSAPLTVGMVFLHGRRERPLLSAFKDHMRASAEKAGRKAEISEPAAQ